MRSRSLAACSYSNAALASFISRWSREITLRSWLAMKVTNWSTIARCCSIVTFCEHGPPQRPIWPAKHGLPVAIALV